MSKQALRTNGFLKYSVSLHLVKLRELMELNTVLPVTTAQQSDLTKSKREKGEKKRPKDLVYTLGSVCCQHRIF